MNTLMKIAVLLVATCCLVYVFVFNSTGFRTTMHAIRLTGFSGINLSQETFNISLVSQASRGKCLIGVESHAENTYGRVFFMTTSMPYYSGQNSSHVLISSYMRSGSTFLGRILGWREDSFYFFEPLWATHQNVYLNSTGKHCSYFKFQCNMPYVQPCFDCIKPKNLLQANLRAAFDKDLKSSLQFIEDIYRCKLAGHFSRIERLIGSHSSADLVGHSWRMYRDCRSAIKSECFRKLIPVCLRARHRVTKLLRMDLELSSKLLMTIPNLKIVHLFRDPRGALNSHIHTGWYPVHEEHLGELEEDIQVLCGRIREDIITASWLVNTFPDRVKIIQYEDFDDPLLKAGRLYEFLGMEFPPETKQLVLNLSVGKGTAGNHPFSYRQDLKWTSVELLNKHCSDIYKQLHYVEFSHENSFRNLSISAIDGHLAHVL